jgi:hypothetical protein
VASFKQSSKVEGWDLENPPSDLCVPGGLPTRVTPAACKPGIMNRLGQLMDRPLREGLGTGAQISPLRLQIRQSLEVLLLRCFGIFGPEAELDLSFANDRLEVVGDVLAKLVASSLGMLPGARHGKGHVHHSDGSPP